MESYRFPHPMKLSLSGNSLLNWLLLRIVKRRRKKKTPEKKKKQKAENKLKHYLKNSELPERDSLIDTYDACRI